MNYPDNYIYNHFTKLGIKKNDHLLTYSNIVSFGIAEKNLPEKIIKIIFSIIGLSLIIIGVVIVNLMNDIKVD
tara:strand:- start:49 stop:267 length:219 start_codon:yes stop_codon:yes gene_type:complete